MQSAKRLRLRKERGSNKCRSNTKCRSSRTNANHEDHAEQMQIKPIKIIYRVNIFDKLLNNNFKLNI